MPNTFKRMCAVAPRTGNLHIKGTSISALPLGTHQTGMTNK